jgi:hypothetical protein
LRSTLIGKLLPECSRPIKVVGFALASLAGEVS